MIIHNYSWLNGLKFYYNNSWLNTSLLLLFDVQGLAVNII